MNITASSDEKMMAALAHGSVFLMFLGPILPVILWASQRKKSKFVSFHALQAMGYQALYFWLWILVTILIAVVIIFLIPFLGTLIENSRDAMMVPFLVQVPIILTIFGLIGLFFVTGIAGAISCLLGHDFRYPFLGTWLEKYLGYHTDPESQIVETQEANWVAGICHATAIFQLWGIATPLIVWFSQKERSARLRFQSMQALIYQLVALVIYMLGMVVYMVFFLGMFLMLIIGGTEGTNNALQGPGSVILIVFLVVMFLFWTIITIGMPIYCLLAGLAGFRVIGGHNFRYPILGKIIEKRIGASLQPEPVT